MGGGGTGLGHGRGWVHGPKLGTAAELDPLPSARGYASLGQFSPSLRPLRPRLRRPLPQKRGLEVYSADSALARVTPATPANFDADLNGVNLSVDLSFAPDATLLRRTARQVFLLVRYHI